jgi:hypothetical protein
MNCLYEISSLGSIGIGRSRVFGLWSKYFAGISDSKGSGINKSKNSCEGRNKSGRIIIAIVFRLLFRCFFSYNITRSFLVISI